MTTKEFEELKNGDICKIIRGKDAGIKCVVLHKEKSPSTRWKAPSSMVVLVKPLHPDDLFDSATVAYRYFKLISHTELQVIISQKRLGPNKPFSFFSIARFTGSFMKGGNKYEVYYRSHNFTNGGNDFSFYRGTMRYRN